LLQIDGEEGCLLQPGDLAIVPHGQGHRLSSERGVAAPELRELEHDQVSERYSILRYGGGGPGTSLVCGAVEFEHPAALELVGLLPGLIHIRKSTWSHAEWLESTLRLMAAEAAELRPGGETVITRLADILVIHAIRWWMQQDPASRTGWLGALQDPQIGRAIALIHRDPAHPWTLAGLAREAAMSRSAFAQRFTRLVGKPAMHYVAHWRMNVALARLQDQKLSLGELSSQVGYQSEAAFSRAFKKLLGSPPGAIRRGRALQAQS
jgi:AraC-like DNA-binding protein